MLNYIICKKKNLIHKQRLRVTELKFKDTGFLCALKLKIKLKLNFFKE